MNDELNDDALFPSQTGTKVSTITVDRTNFKLAKCPVLKAPNSHTFRLERLPYRLGITVSPKMDGIRALILPSGHVVSAQGRQFPNKSAVHGLLEGAIDYCINTNSVLDGEIYSHELGHLGPLAGALNSHGNDLPPGTVFSAFDWLSWHDYIDECQNLQASYATRLIMLHSACKMLGPNVVFTPQFQVESPERIRALFDDAIQDGYEGLIIRTLHMERASSRLRMAYAGAAYKHGRATESMNCIWKMKAWQTHDARIIAVHPRREMKDGTERTVDEWGRLEPVRSKSAYNETDVVGAFEVQSTADAGVCRVGFAAGFPLEKRRELWARRDELIGKWVEYRFLNHGLKDGAANRHGLLVRFRPDIQGAR